MSLSGQQCKQLQVALIGTFTNTSSLEQMLEAEMNNDFLMKILAASVAE
ncbi:MAG: effector-associated domain EAD1-containing protein [Rhizonema sp. PD37]|nr:effector-associated domain EAD1-containing protein [Rhizonema sp. PD37]